MKRVFYFKLVLILIVAIGCIGIAISLWFYTPYTTKTEEIISILLAIICLAFAFILLKGIITSNNFKHYIRGKD